MNKNKEIIELIEGMERSERVGLIYRWHNALEIERFLKIDTIDNSFEFVAGDMTGNLVFKNNEGKVLEITEYGEYVSGDKDVLSPSFFKYCQARLQKTKQMLSKMGL